MASDASFLPRPFTSQITSGSSVRWRIRKANGEPMGIAGIYKSWTDPEGKAAFGMAMLTVNADDHLFMKRFHGPIDEKRMVVILEREDFEGWLTCPVDEAKTRYCKQWQGELAGAPAALPKRTNAAPKAVKKKDDPLSGVGATEDLF